jgi:peptidyl-prolyl cis-trans isomerase SurA
MKIRVHAVIARFGAWRSAIPRFRAAEFGMPRFWVAQRFSTAITASLLRAASAAALCFLLLGAFCIPSAHAGEVIDRIVATVNGHLILQSDWDEDLCYEALLTNRPLDKFTDDDRRAVLDRLIDQELLREQMKSADFRRATDQEANARIADARKQYPQATSADAWHQLLVQYHLTEADLLTHVRQEIDVMRLVEARLRPGVQIDSKSIEAYYRDQFVPKLKESGASEVPLAEVSGKIRELLTEQKVSELLVSWLQTLRSESQVQIPGVNLANDPAAQSR